MKVFISWSGNTSRIIAEGLYNWLPKVVQAVKPFFSPEIEKGTKGIEEINKNLEGTSFGIICLTRDNLNSIWIHYETGALSKIEGARTWTLLFNLKHSDIVQPLAQFQHTLPEKRDLYKLLDSINSKLGEQKLEESVLVNSFEKWWSEFEDVLANAQKSEDEEKSKDTTAAPSIRADRDILIEILELSRYQQQKFTILEKSIDEKLNDLYENSSPKTLDFYLKQLQRSDEAEYIGFEFFVMSNDELKPKLKKSLIKLYLALLPITSETPKFFDTSEGFKVQVMSAKTFSFQFLRKVDLETQQLLGKRLDSWTPIKTSEFA